MALSKIEAESVNLADDFAFTGTVNTISTTVPAEGGSATTNLVQGLAKSWARYDQINDVNRDSFRKYELSVFNIKEEHPDLLTKCCTRWAASDSSGKLFRKLCPLAWNYKIVRDKEAGFDTSIFNLLVSAEILSMFIGSPRLLQRILCEFT